MSKVAAAMGTKTTFEMSNVSGLAYACAATGGNPEVSADTSKFVVPTGAASAVGRAKRAICG
jgi:hypothetical protein